MLLGKRPRQYNPMKRTTSMKEIIFDPIHANPDHQIIDGGGNTTTYLHPHHHQHQPTSDQIGAVRGGADATAVMVDQRNATATAAWGGGGGGGAVLNNNQIQRRHSADFVENYLSANQNNHLSSNFLRDCALCKRRLIPGRDIFMYRGDSAFCSSECRQQQISKDQREEKCSLSKRGSGGADNNNNNNNKSNSSSAKVSVK